MSSVPQVHDSRHERAMMRKLLQSPQAEDYWSQKEKEEKKLRPVSKKPLWAGLLLAGAGAGSKRFGEWVISPEEAAIGRDLIALDNLIDRNTQAPKKEWESSVNFLSQYLDRAGRAANIKLFGGKVPASDIIKAYRKRLPDSDPNATKTPERIAGAEEHYKTFASGPLQAFLHYRKDLKAPLVDFVARQKGLTVEQAESAFGDLTKELPRDLIPRGEQSDLVSRFLLDPEIVRTTNVSEWVPKMNKSVSKSAIGYINAARAALLATHDIPVWAGRVGMGVGAGLVSGWGTYKLWELLRRNKKEREVKARLQAARTKAVKGFYETLPKAAAFGHALAKARKQTDTSPSEAKVEAGNYRKGKVRVRGLTVTIENPKGSVRKGTDKSGKKWEVELKHDYGYFNKTEASDGDHVDVFLGPDPEHGRIWVIDQHVGGKYDEPKTVLGAKDEKEAREIYLSNYEKGWNGIGHITEMTEEGLQEWLKAGAPELGQEKEASPAWARLLTSTFFGGLRQLGRVPRYVAKVPAGQKYFSSPGAGVRRVARTFFNPHLGKANWAKYGINAYVAQDILRNAGTAALGAARDAAPFIPDPEVRAKATDSLSGNVMPRLRAVGETLSIPSFDWIPEDARPRVSRRMRSAAGSALERAGRYHPEDWAQGKRLLEPLKTVASPMHKPIQRGIGKALSWWGKEDES